MSLRVVLRVRLLSIGVLIASMPVFCQAQVTALSFRPIAAGYSVSLDQMILISANPNQLHIYSVQGQADHIVALPAAPMSVAISPDGLHAAVGYSSQISYVSLSTSLIEKTFLTSVPAASLAVSSTWIYAFYGANSLSINIGTGSISSFGLPSYENSSNLQLGTEHRIWTQRRFTT